MDIKELITAETTRNEIKALGLNGLFARAYTKSVLRAGNDTIDFEDTIWDCDIEEIVRDCKKFGFKEFTISSEMSGLVCLLEKLENLGVKMDKLVRVKSQYTDRNGEHEIVPAIKMIID